MAIAFNRVGQYASSPGNSAYCYAELPISSLAVAKTISVLTVPTNAGMARLSRPGWLVKYPRMITDPSTNPARLK